MMNTFGPRGTSRIPTQNETARDFVRLFGPVVYALARKRGFGDAAAADLTQEVLTRAAQNEGHKADDSGRNTIHARLITATQSAIAAIGAAKEDRSHRASGTPDLNADWESEFQRQLAKSAMGFVKREFPSLDWQAFWGTAVDGRPEAVVARELGMTSGTVHVVKCRVLARLHEEMHRLRLEAESWGGPARSADQQKGDVAQNPDRLLSSQAPIYLSAPAPGSAERTSLHIPRCWKQ
ncbi:RNA polymerase sigma factor, sigma-70 family OS=Planctomyces limnophilus (strain ATCC 43296 / DSM 3776 / IFAM 1008 / 290) GN=Plim_0986 PE=4 SV=1 [Gemmata massiliana]|uniref:RNA polymerase sigma factor, sigma-70 family n=1 Tax=Gemmata massiliana TaxID=1210884 RepID=A0A6P2D9L0_9BACT|nr:sigma-70 family RNA polymerase sigma factor [Gemmata massiliana]VTR98031.1 RNA polymerase sigma factor, sigma-70 family OS=Planctomyces limnophilus (strain ATCC 43296 / DSM 3776 / IFAM 1008 / 290) GN=Plim_0986 PE=4 SV=1 [Gemmata massiliana]